MTPLRSLVCRAQLPLQLQQTWRTPIAAQAGLSSSRAFFLPAATHNSNTSTSIRTMASSSATPTKDWSADQYLKFHDERTRATHDLVHRIPLPGGRFPLTSPDSAAASTSPRSSSLSIVDLGCGPGNSTAVLAERFPGASLAGVDSSPNMIAKAKQTLPGVPFEIADLRTYTPPQGANLLLANAVLQWLPLADRLPTVLRLFSALPPGGVFAYQVPDNQQEPANVAMREVAYGQLPGTENGSWVSLLKDVHIRDSIEPVADIYDALAPHAQPGSVDVWRSTYHHILPGGARDIIEWLRGTGLQPYLHALAEDGDAKQAYLAAYEKRLAELHPTRVDGSVLLPYPRLFVVAVKK